MNNCGLGKSVRNCSETPNSELSTPNLNHSFISITDFSFSFERNSLKAFSISFS
jgi:hypothetical protein